MTRKPRSPAGDVAKGAMPPLVWTVSDVAPPDEYELRGKGVGVPKGACRPLRQVDAASANTIGKRRKMIQAGWRKIGKSRLR